ncbi:MAG TPA: hypothetical protein VL986_02175 [Terracidiphilus sp.]|nr:hypothetical protein [Terracidiphilus sp.]
MRVRQVIPCKAIWGEIRQEWLYGFSWANFGAAGDVRRTNSVFHDPTLPPVY